MDSKQVKNILLWSILYVVFQGIVLIAIELPLMMVFYFFLKIPFTSVQLTLNIIIFFFVAIFVTKHAVGRVKPVRNNKVLHGFLIGLVAIFITLLIFSMINQSTMLVNITSLMPYSILYFLSHLGGASLGGYLAKKK